MAVDERWYVALTGPNREADAYINLHRQGYGVFWPRRWHTWSRDGHTTSELRPYLSRYLFASVGEHQSVYAINETDGVSRVLTQAGEAYQIPTATIWEIRKDFDPDGVEPPGTRTAKHIRKLLRGIKGEEAAELLAVLDRIDDRGKVRVRSRSRAVRLAAGSLPLLQRKTAETSRFGANCGAFA